MDEWERPLPVGKRGKYTYTPDKVWANDAPITNPIVTASAGVAVESVVTDGEVIEVLLRGVTVGSQTVHFDYEAGGQSSCYAIKLNVRSC